MRTSMERSGLVLGGGLTEGGTLMGGAGLTSMVARWKGIGWRHERESVREFFRGRK